jgi:hypothetical protein
VVKPLFLNDLRRFFTRNEHQSKAQSPQRNLCCDTTTVTDMVMPILDCGLGPGEVGFAPVECASPQMNKHRIQQGKRSTGKALHPSTSMAYGAGRARIAESKVKHGNFEL